MPAPARKTMHKIESTGTIRIREYQFPKWLQHCRLYENIEL
jgi:hypothetical protein